MKAEEAKDMMQAKLICMELDGLSCIGKGCDHDCDNCEYNYAQGNMGEQKEAVKMAIEALEKQIPKKAIEVTDEGFRFIHVFRCPNCNEKFGGRTAKYCYHCGQALDWSEEE